MKTYLILKDASRYRALPMRTEMPTGKAPTIDSETFPTQEQCAEAWQGFIPVQPTPSTVPRSIKAWQAKAILSATPHSTAGTMLAAAEAAIDAMADGMDKIAIQSAWGNNADFSRSASAIVTLAAALGIDDPQLDAMFLAGAALKI